jgi:translation initiation factor IF-2
MKKILINRILNEYVIKESLVVDDSSYIDEIKQIELLSDTDTNLENKLDKIWNSLEIKTKKNGTDMSKFNSTVNQKIKDLVDKLSKKGKNPSIWVRRKLICNLWE